MLLRKVISRTFPLLICCTSGLALAAPHALSAQGELDFFEQNSALTVFDTDVTKSDIPRLKMLREIEEKKPELAPQAEVIEGTQPANNPAVSAAPQTPHSPLTPPTSEQIVAKYGDPNKDALVKAQDNAPAPFKAMLEAFSAGNDQLAYQYANQYVRYLRNLKQTVKRAVDYQKIAMEQEGVSPERAGDPALAAEKAILGDQLKSREMTQGGARQDLSGLDPKLRAMLEAAGAKEGVSNHEIGLESEGEAPIDSARIEMSPAEKNQRLAALQKIRQRAPIDPKGEVHIYLFFKPNDPKSQETARALTTAFQKFSRDPRVKVVGFTMDIEDQGTLENFKYRNKISFPIQDGAAYARKMQITHAPTLIALARSTGKAVAEHSLTDQIYIEELIKYMQGIQ